MSREALRDGYVRPDGGESTSRRRTSSGSPAALANDATPFAPARARYWRRHPVARLKGQALNLARAVGLYVRLMRRVESARAAAPLSRGRSGVSYVGSSDPGRLFGYVIRCAMHYHHITLSRARWRGTRARS